MSLMPLILLDVVLLPGEVISLNVQDQAVKQVIADSQAGNGLFVTIPQKDAKTNGFGMSVRLMDVLRKYPNGDLDVRIRAMEIVQVNQFYDRHPLKLYPAVVITPLATDIYRADHFLINEFKKFAFRYLPKERLIDTLSGDIFEIAIMLGLTEEQKLKMLRLFNAQEMTHFLINIIRTRAALINQESQLQGNYFLN